MRKITFLTGFAAGYVAGSRAGRERYEQIAKGARTVMSNPRVQQTTDKAKHQASDLADTAKHQASGFAGTAKDKVTSKMEDRKSSSDDLADFDTPGAGTARSDSYGTSAEDSVFVVDLNEHVATGTGPTGNNDRMGL